VKGGPKKTMQRRLAQSTSEKAPKKTLQTSSGKSVRKIAARASPGKTIGKVLPAKAKNNVLSVRATRLRKGSKAYKKETEATKKALTKLYDEQSSDESSGKKLAVKLIYRLSTGEFYIKEWDDTAKKYKSKESLVEDIEDYNEDLVKAAVTFPGTWMFPRIGDPSNGIAPDYLKTTVPTAYQQHEKAYCLTYSMASALLYCGFKDQAEWLAGTAPIFSAMDYTTAITRLRAWMAICVPIIGQPTIYGKRTARHNRFKRHFTWEDLFNDITTYPTLVVPILPNGDATHAFCVVDDLIFDSITPNALKLHMDSVKWVFNDSESRIFLALRFNKTCNPKGMKKKEEYPHVIEYHWDHLSQYNSGLSPMLY